MIDFSDVAEVREWVGRDYTNEALRHEIVDAYDCRITHGETPMQAAKYALHAHIEEKA